MIPGYAIERRTLGIVVQIGSWRFTVHHTDCADYLRSQERNRNRPVSPGMRLVVCGHCRPAETLVGPFLSSVAIYGYSHGGIGRTAPPPRPRAVLEP